MRVTCLHAGWLASLPPALRNDLIAALSPAEAVGCSSIGHFGRVRRSLPLKEIGGCGSFSPAADLERLERAQS